MRAAGTAEDPPEPGNPWLIVQKGSTSQVLGLRGNADREALAAFLTDFLELRGPARVAHAQRHQSTDFSVHSTALMRSISLINPAPMRDLAPVDRPLGPRHFRANVYFDEAKPWSELNWVGGELRCGGVRLRVVRRTRRCPATSVDPSNGIRDINVPLAIPEYREQAGCGIHSEVLTDGC